MIGINDEEFIRGNVPMTKQEVRILTIVKANIKPSDVVIDIGAGTGSLSIEAAQLARQVYAIERNPEAIELIEQNVEKFGINNIIIINAEAPNGIEAIKKVDVVLIGGSGGNLTNILDTIDKRLKPDGKIVLNCITVQTLAESLQYFKTHDDYKYDAIQVQINRLQTIAQYDMAKALNPIYIVTAVKLLNTNH